jgi:hypothetical protein
MHLPAELERPKRSALLSGLSKERREARRDVDPGSKILAAYALSVEARRLLIAGLQSQGFTEAEIRAVLRSRRR